MTINTDLLIQAPILQNYLVDKATGLPLAAGVVTLYKDSSRSVLKNWYYQSGVPGAYTYLQLDNPLTLSASGTIMDPNGSDVLPLYYPYSESDNLMLEPYYITVLNSEGTTQFTRENFPFNTDTTGTTAGDSTNENYIINNRFWHNIGSADLSSETNLVIAPSQHDTFRQPDIRFIKDVTGATEEVTFKKFALGETPLINDITPEYYINHSCTAAKATEGQKVYQFPIAPHVQNLDSVQGTITIQAKNVGGSANKDITLFIYQDLGTGVTSSDPVQQEVITLTNTWTKYTYKFTFPSASEVTLSDTGDDAFYLQIGMPIGLTCDIDFTLPSIYLSSTVPTNEFSTYDQIDTVINSPRTGDIRTSLNSFQPFGWVAANNGSIGSATSAASNRQNVDTWPLYNLLWNNVLDAWAPVSSGRGASAYADFTADKTLTLPTMLGRVLAGLDADFATGSEFTINITTTTISSVDTGADTITLTSIGQLTTGSAVRFTTSGGLPAPLVAGTTYYIRISSGATVFLYNNIQNAIDNVNTIDITSAGTGTQTVTNVDTRLTLTTATTLQAGTPVQLTVSGGTLPSGLSASQVYYVSSKDLSTTIVTLNTDYDLAVAGYDINFWDAGSGTFTISTALGATFGESSHTLTESEMPTHNHGLIINNQNSGSAGNASVGDNGENLADYSAKNYIQDTGGSNNHNIMQPTLYANVFLKL